MRIYIGVLKKQLYISVQNSVGGELRKAGNRYLSTKHGSEHGLGLVRVDSIVKKNKGYIRRQNEEGVFATEVFLPV